jgi:hypothetical protein
MYKKLREHAKNCDVPSSPGLTYRVKTLKAFESLGNNGIGK